MADENRQRELVRSALDKRAAGKRPSRDEGRALRVWEKQREEQLRQEYYASIPKKHWCELSGRQGKVLNEQAIRYGIPIGDRTINLGQVARWLHDFLAANRVKLAAEDDPLYGPETPSLELLRHENYLLARLTRRTREGQLVPRGQVRDELGRLASLLRRLGEQLQRRCGDEARTLLDETLDEFNRGVERAFEEGSEGPRDQGRAS